MCFTLGLACSGIRFIGGALIHDYDNPNTCYAIGDCFGVLMGPAEVNRQPAAGVFEEVSSAVTDGTTATLDLFDGTNNEELIRGSVTTGVPASDAGSIHFSPYNMAVKIGNTVYLRKRGTVGRIGVSGVQVDE